MNKKILLFTVAIIFTGILILFFPYDNSKQTPASFVRDTQIQTPHGSVRIEDLAEGDTVLSYDFKSGKWIESQVIKASSFFYDSIAMTTISLQNEEVRCTGHHPVYVTEGDELKKRLLDRSVLNPVTQGWVRAGDLRSGDIIINSSGENLEILNISTVFQSSLLYDLELSDIHNFSVGNSGMLVGDITLVSDSLYEAEPQAGDMNYSSMALEEMMIESEIIDSAPMMSESKEMKKESAPNIKRIEEANPILIPDQLFLSADDSNSCASPVIVRNIINNGRYVHPSLIRTYEFYNYYSFGYPAPEEGDLGVYANMHNEGDGVFSIQAVLRSPDRIMDNLPPLNIVFLLDSSGSMAGEPWDLSKEFVYRYIDFLRPGDTFAIVTVDRYAEVLIDQFQVNSGAAEYAKIKLDKVIPDDITNLDPGIAQAYKIAESFHNNDELTRVIFVSDGGANAGDYSGRTVSEYAADGDSQGIYLTGVGVGSGFNDGLMNMLTDSGRGAYFFLDTPDEIDHILKEFLSYFDLAYKDVRLGMQLPPGWEIRSFHGEQISTVREDIVPQYLAPNDQMIFHMELNYTGNGPIKQDKFTFEAEFTPIGAEPDLVVRTFTVEQMISSSNQLMKANAITAFAEGLKTMVYPLESNRILNLDDWDNVIQSIKEIQAGLNDREIDEIIGLANRYRRILDNGEHFPDSADLKSWDIPSTLGLSDETVLDVTVEGPSIQQAVRSIERLGSSVRLQPTEGYRFLGLSSGPVGNPQPAGSGQLSNNSYSYPHIEYMGRARYYTNKSKVYDLHTITLRLKAPSGSKSFSFDLNYFSAEYPDFVNQSFNDSFYAILQAPSTNHGLATNITFDPDQNPLEVDNNYFQRRFHPIPNNGTGFDYNGSTGWLRTSWPIKGGEEFTLTFTIHDEGDAIYDSIVLLDNFLWHDYPAVGNTDPLN